jgi:serine/threonine-protein kinase
VKPGNIFLSPEGHVTLLDLGFARRTDGKEPVTDRAVSGTWQYMAPETFLSASGVDIRSDLYSLGAVWFEMLAGRPPFVGSSAAALSQQHREARPRGLEDVVSRLPSSAGRLLRQMLSKHPLRRPQTAREVIDCLLGAEIATLAHRFTA